MAIVVGVGVGIIFLVVLLGNKTGREMVRDALSFVFNPAARRAYKPK